MTDEEVTEFADEFGLDPSEEYYNWDGTLTDARRILKEDENYKAEMFKEYKAGRLDPEAGSVSQARLSFLRQKESTEIPDFQSGDKAVVYLDNVILKLGIVSYDNNQPILLTPDIKNFENLRVVIND